jgi:acetylornithine deacetylase/succinyl-diaminopimelate desuccinylase-like protein
VERALFEAVHAFAPALHVFTSRLIQTRSVNGLHPEHGLAEVIAAEAARLGLHAEIVGEQPSRPNVIVSTAPGGETGLLLLGHLDTVPPGDASDWTHPPFSGAVADGRIYGRGACDTKGGMAASLYALAALARIPGALERGRAQFIGVPDEETGATGTLGIKYLDARGLLHGLGAIYAYSGHEITLGHRGLLRYKLVCTGQAIHTGAQAWQDGTGGANAVTGMARLLLALESLSFPHSTAPYFTPYRTVITPGTMISGGTSINIVPDRCEALVDIRLTPEATRPAIEAQIDTVIEHLKAHSSRLSWTYTCLNDVPAAMSDEHAPLISAVESAVLSVTGAQPPRGVAGPANEGYLLIERGIPTICGLGPMGENAHAPDEYVELNGLVDAAAIFALTAHRLARHLPDG